jgi:signal peptidase
MTDDPNPGLQPRTLGRVAVAVVLLALIAPFVVYAVPGTVGAEASYVVLTASMTPAIAPGDVVIVDEVRAESVVVGDVIVFQRRAGDPVPVTHRVIAVERTDDGTPVFRTRGDANEDADVAPVTPDRLVGRVSYTVPLVGHVVRFVGTPIGFVALVVAPIGLLIASEVADLLRSGRSSGAGDPDGDDGDDGDGDTRSADDPAATVAPSGGQFTVTPADLTLTSGVLGVFAAFAGYAAFQRPTGVSVGVAVAVGATFALAVGVRTLAPPASAPTADSAGHDAVIPSVRIDDRSSGGPTVELPSPADLRAVAATLGRPVLSDGRRHVVLDGPVTYACPASPVADALESGGADARTDDGPASPPALAADAGRRER